MSADVPPPTPLSLALAFVILGPLAFWIGFLVVSEFLG